MPLRRRADGCEPGGRARARARRFSTTRCTPDRQRRNSARDAKWGCSKGAVDPRFQQNPLLFHENARVARVGCDVGSGCARASRATPAPSSTCNAGALVNAGAGGARWWERRFLRNAKTQNPTLTLATEFARITARLAEFSPVTTQGGRRSLRRRCRALRAPRPLALVRHDGCSRAAE